MTEETRIADGPLQRIPIGTRLSDLYQIDSLIGIGGMGEVYRGHAIETGDQVAIKTILPEFAGNESALGLFRKEASALHNLYHEAIVRYFVFTIDRTLGIPFLAMEYVEGSSLSDLLQRGPLDYADLVVLTRRIASGLQAAHDLGIVHRDISPDNIILPGANPGRAKIIDFGIARSPMGGKTIIGGGFAGKFAYVSPEQLGLQGGNVTGQSDIYSLGLVVAQAALGKPLDMGGTHAEVIERRRRVPDLSAVDARIRPLVAAMLEPDPRERIGTMAEIAAWQAPAAGKDAPAPKSTRRFALAGVAAAAVVAIGVVGAIVGPALLSPSDPGQKVGRDLSADGPLLPSDPVGGGTPSGGVDTARTETGGGVGSVGTSAGSESAGGVLGGAPSGQVAGSSGGGATPSAGPVAGPGAQQPAGSGASPAGAGSVAGGGGSASGSRPAGAGSETSGGAAGLGSSGSPTAGGPSGGRPSTPGGSGGRQDIANLSGPSGGTGGQAGGSGSSTSGGSGGVSGGASLGGGSGSPGGTGTPGGPTTGPGPTGGTTQGGASTLGGGSTPGGASTPGGSSSSGTGTSSSGDGRTKEGLLIVPPPALTMEEVATFIRQYRGGDCFFVAPASVSSREATIEGMGSTAAPFIALERDFKNSLGFEPNIRLQQVTGAQCPVVQFLSRHLALKKARAPKVSLRQDVLRNGQDLSGTAESGGESQLELLLVADDGRVHNITSSGRRAGDALSFSLRLDGASGSSKPQLVLAVASARSFASLKAGAPDAERFVKDVEDESARTGSPLSVAVRYFKFGG